MQNPVRGFLHGSGALVSIAGLVWLLMNSAGGISRKVALTIFGLSLVTLYTTSTLYHTIPWRDIWKRRMQAFDQSAIFVLVAGTYTPFAVVVFPTGLMVLTLALVWGIALAGIVQLHFLPRPTTGLAIGLITTLGWLGVLFAYPIAQYLPWTALALILAGGLCYTVGLVFLLTGRPRLWPRVFSYHEAFHVLVIAGSLFHYAAVTKYVAGFPDAA